MLANKYPQYEIGIHSYGSLEIIDYAGSSSSIKIGRYCSFARQTAVLLGGEHGHRSVSTYPFFPLWGAPRPDGFTGTKGNIEIGSDVWMGYGSTILSGVVVGDGAVIAAGAMVVRDVEPYMVVGGVPAGPIRTRFIKPAIDELLKIKWWEWPEARVRVFMPLMQGNDVWKFIEEARCLP